MFRHVVLFKFVDGVSAEQVETMAEGLRALPATVPTVRSFDVGPALSGTHDFAIVADFDDEAGWHVYDEHPDHVRVRDELIRPYVADRAVVRYVL